MQYFIIHSNFNFKKFTHIRRNQITNNNIYKKNEKIFAIEGVCRKIAQGISNPNHNQET